MEYFKSKPRIQIPIPNHMKRSSSSNSDAHIDSPHSPLRFHSPLRSDQGDPPESPDYASPIASPEKLPPSTTTTTTAAAAKSTQYSPALSPLPQLAAGNVVAKEVPSPQPAAGNVVAKEVPSPQPAPPVLVTNRAMRDPGQGTAVRKVGPEGGGRGSAMTAILKRSKMEERTRVLELGFRLSAIACCLISFSIMAADKTQGWSGDSFDRYKEYRYCLSVNVIGFVYAGFQAYDLSYHLVTGKHVISHHLGRHFSFFLDQVLAYLLMSSSSSAATRVDDWQSNWGKDKFTEMATASIAMSFLAFAAFGASSLFSGYKLCNSDSSS